MPEFLQNALNAVPVDALDQLKTSAVSDYLPRFGKALAILIIGWLVAFVVSFIVRFVISRTGLNKQLAKVLPSSGGKVLNVGRMIGKAVFYLIMLFVVVAFLQALELTMVTEPLNAFLSQVMQYFPRLIGAGVLGGVAWVIATVLKKVSHDGLQAMDLDSKLTSLAGDAADEVETLNADGTPAMKLPQRNVESSLGLPKTISETLYWLVFLLFLPAILGALNMPGLLEPIQGMIQKGMDFLPNLIGAAVIGGVGWFVARIVQKVVTNLLAAAGADRLADKAGIGESLGSTKLSGLLGLIVHALILIPVIVAALDALKIEAVTKPVSAMLGQMTEAVPGMFGGAMVLGIAFFVGQIVSNLATNVLSGVGFDNVPQKLGLAAAAPEATKPSTLVGKLIMAAILFFAAMQAMNFVGLDMVAGQMNEFLGFFFQILVGLVVVGLGLYLSNIAAETIKATGMKDADTLAKVARIAIMVLAGAMGLQRMGLADSIVNLTFGLTLGAVAVASAISFGWGGRDVAKRVLEKYVA